MQDAIRSRSVIAGGRFPGKEVIPYILAQVVDTIIAALVLYAIASGFASNGYGAHSPGGCSIGFFGITIGLALTVIPLISIPVTNNSVNPARSTGLAIIRGGWALGQL